MASPNPVQSTTTLFRRLTWQSAVTISIRLADSEPGAGNACDRYYIKAPRYSYLPFFIPEIRENLVELALDDAQLEQIDEKNWWFEEELPEDKQGFVPQGACRWHWPIDLVDIHSFIQRPQPLPSSSELSATPRVISLLLHLSNPPQDRLLMPNSIEVCKSQWLNQMKEADFVRWRNTNRVTNLRRVDLEAGWDGILNNDFDLYTQMANKIVPLPLLATSNSTQPSRPPSTDPSGPTRAPDSSYATRAVPFKIYLPDNAPVIQEIVPPISESGKPTTLLAVLQTHLPLLFPTSFKDPYERAFPIAQGILVPQEAEVAWIASCLCGADGWVRVGVCLSVT
ncbi:autophagy protein 5 [Cryptococcus decagattii]|uniref:Autophagy protein 5 n=1 Tax=Cryptococcus decagattii TaxID=1859122 RepID=A0ABZ2B1G8_9TREE